MERLRQQKRDQDDEVARMKAFIDRFRYQATKAAQVQSRIKMLGKIVPIEIPPSEASSRYLRTKKEKLGHLLRSV